MMARHVVDSQHFQRIPPDMCISADEILFRAQTGCPLELGELAIHCVQFQPTNRPKLQNIVERLTAIENVDIHVGTTLLVAPSVARAARNMMRKREAEVKRNQPPPNPFLDPESQFQHPSSVYRSGGTVRAHRSSIIDESNTNTWRMTDPENRESDDSQNTFNGRRAWKGASQDSGTSNVPLVLDARYQTRKRLESQDNNTSDDESVVRRRGDGNEEPTFRMPPWDTINSPGHQGWSGSESVQISTVNGDNDEASLQSWDQERYPPAPSMQYIRHETDSVRLSSIQLDIRDDDEEEDEFFERGSGFLSGSSDEDSNDSLFDEDSDNDDIVPGIAGQPLGRAGPGHGYQLSSDSDGSSIDTDSVTESLVLALDTLEIPDHANKHTKKSPSPVQVPLNPVSTSPPATSPSQSPPASPRIDNSLFRQPSLISRLLPPIPVLGNPWGTARQSPPPGVAQVLIHTSDHEDEPSESSRLIAKLASATAYKLEDYPEEEPLGSKVPEMVELPPAPPSKSSSLLVRTNTWKAKQIQQLPQEPNGLVSPSENDSPSGVSPANSTSTCSLAELGSSSSSTSLPSNPDDLLLSSTSLDLFTTDKDKDFSEEQLESRTTTATNTLRSISPSPRKPSGPRDRPNSPTPPGLIRGMSDSFWSKSHSSAEAVNTLTSTMVMNARTWTGSTAFGSWIAGASSSTGGAASGTSTANNTLKMPTISIPEEEDNVENGTHDETADQEKVKVKVKEKAKENDKEEVETGEETKHHLVKRRSIKRTLTKAVSSPHLTLTGISHRFSLVAFSALLPPKCDVCQKRIGVLPGWSSKHLECDGKTFYCFVGFLLWEIGSKIDIMIFFFFLFLARLDCGYRAHPKCVNNVVKCCTSARKSGVWDISA